MPHSCLSVKSRCLWTRQLLCMFIKRVTIFNPIQTKEIGGQSLVFCKTFLPTNPVPEGLDYFLDFYISGNCLSQEIWHQFPNVLLHKFQQKVNLNVLRKFAKCSVNMTFDIPFLKVSSQLVMYTYLTRGTLKYQEHLAQHHTMSWVPVTCSVALSSTASILVPRTVSTWCLNTVKNTSPRA